MKVKYSKAFKCVKVFKHYRHSFWTLVNLFSTSTCKAVALCIDLCYNTRSNIPWTNAIEILKSLPVYVLRKRFNKISDRFFVVLKYRANFEVVIPKLIQKRYFHISFTNNGTKIKINNHFCWIFISNINFTQLEIVIPLQTSWR